MEHGNDDAVWVLRERHGKYGEPSTMKTPLTRMLGWIVCGLLVTGTARATLIDLSDNSFLAVTYDVGGPIIEFTEAAGGVEFTFKRLVGQFREVGTWSDGTTNATGPWALDLGGASGSVSAFTLTANADVVLESFVGLARTSLVNPTFDVTGAGVTSVGNTFSTSGVLGGTPGTDLFVAGPLALAANTSYTFTVTNASAITLGYITGLNFSLPGTGSVSVPSAPLALLLASGLGLLAGLRCRAKT